MTRDGALALGHYSPSSIATKKTPDATAKTSHTAPTTPLTGKTKLRPMVSMVAHTSPVNVTCETLNIYSRFSSTVFWLLADMRGKFPPLSAVIGAKVRRLYTIVLTVARLSAPNSSQPIMGKDAETRRSRDRSHLRDRMFCKFVRSTLRNRRCYTQQERRSYTRILGPNTPDKSLRGSSLGSEKRWLRRLGRPPPPLRRRPRCHIPAPVLAHSRDVDIEIEPGRDQ